MRSFDVREQFEEIKKAAAEAVRAIFPIEGKLRKIELNGITVEDKLDPTDYVSQAKIKSQDGTFGVPVYAALTLIDKQTGKVLDKSLKTRLFMLPKATDRLSYIVNGNEYQVHNQLRRKSGVYTVRKQNGELKSNVNLAQGKNFDLMFNESSGVFSITQVGGGQANIPLYPILTYLGVSHNLIGQTWGEALANTNKGTDPKAVTRAQFAFGVKRGDLKEYFEKTKLDPDNTALTLGSKFSKVDGPMLLATSKKLLDVHLGKKEPEDFNSIEFKELHSLEDFIKERLEKNKDTLAFKVRRSIDAPNRTKISQIVNPGAFNNVIESFFTQDDKSSTPEQTNPLDMLSGQYKVTIMGSGGIRSEHAVTPEMRNIHPTHYGFIDPIHTPESSRIGANLHVPLGVVKDGKDIKMLVKDKSGKALALKPSEAFNSVIAFPGQKGNRIKALHKGETILIHPSEADYTTPSPQALFSISTNLIPFLPSNQGNRAMMAAKQMEQAISLKNREAPLVQVGAGATGGTFEKYIGEKSAIVSPADGTIKKVTDDVIVLTTKDGDVKLNLYNNFALNRKSYLHHESKVKAGDKVKEGQVLADSNYTKNGTLALGTNLRAAYIPYRGLNFEDGIVVTESAAEKLTSAHVYKKSIDIDENVIVSLKTYRTQYPNVMTPDNMSKLDDEGVIKKGQKVKMGEAVIVALQQREPSKQIGLIQRQLADRPKDVSVTWGFEDEGLVTDVHKSSKTITVFIKTEEKAKIGDKLAGRMGNKGIITKIIADSEAPHSADGKPVDILLNPHGVISRINIGQIYESAAGKAALKTGKTHVVQNFSGEDYLDTTKKFLSQTKTDDKEELFDPKTGKSLGRVHVGNPYILKLYKLSTSNFSTRQGGPGHPYDINLQPLKAGGEESAKSLDLLTMYSMLSHGANANLREMSTIKANQNDEFWKALKSGQQLPPPKAPFVYEKFLSYLKAAGIDVKKNGSRLTLAPFTDKEVRAISAQEVKKPVFYRSKDMEPIRGGFFDPSLGGFKGTKWGHIELEEPVLNPVFETAVRKITGLGGKFDEIMAGKLHLHNGAFNKEGKGVTSGKALEQILKGINVDAEIKDLTAKSKVAKASVLDDINKKLRYFIALKTHDLKPEEAYLRKVVPIVPPIYRPVYTLPDGNVTSSDVNFLYQNLGVLNTLMKSPVMDLLAEEEKAPIREDMYHHVKGISGLTDINIKGRERAGFISEIKGGMGGQPKEGFFINKVLSKKQDYVGRGTIIPEPTLGVDEVALPEAMAWKLFEPFVIRELSRHGKTPIQAMEEIKNRSLLSKKALEIVMKERHVLLNRAPSLHKFSIMAFKPQITSGTAIKIPPLVVKGFNCDFDGDTMTIHLPITDEANKEAEGMLPSKNLYQPGTGKLMLMPAQEAQIGIFYLSKTDAGRKLLNNIVGAKNQIRTILNKKETYLLLTKLSKELDSNKFGEVLSKLKAEGEKHAFETGFTLGMEDLQVATKERDSVVNKIEAMGLKTKSQSQLNLISNKANEIMNSILEKKLKNTNNPLYDMVESGARGEASQLRQILSAPMFVNDAKGKIVPSIIKKSYAEGLDIGDYWTSMYGARKGMMDRAIQTSLPGAFSKDIMASTVDNVISSADCGTTKGTLLTIDSPDILDRFLASSQGGLPRNTLVDQITVNKLKKAGLKAVVVRTPLTCLRPKGVCQKCYGLDENGQVPEIGENIGAKAGQTISEPLIQLVMNTFHTGGAAGTGADVGGYKRIDQLLRLPKVVVGSATLAPKQGRVTNITTNPAGGFDVYVEDVKVRVLQGRQLKVKVGDMVDAGDPLSDGVIKPQDLVKYKGMQPAQEYMVHELKKAYADQGVNIHRKVFETIIRSLGNTTQVLNNPKGSSFIPGDIIPYTVAVHHNENLRFTVPTEDALGAALANNYGPLKKGHELDSKDLKILRTLGHNEVEVDREAIKHTPVLKSVNTLPILKQNWMSALGYRNLAKALVEGAGQAWHTDLEDYHPIPAFAHGATFGMGKGGKY